MLLVLLLVSGIATAGAVLLVLGEVSRSRVERAVALERIRAYRRPGGEASERRRPGRPSAPAWLLRGSRRLSGRSEDEVAASLSPPGSADGSRHPVTCCSGPPRRRVSG